MMPPDTPVSELMTTPVISARPDDSIARVGDILRQHALAFVPVVDEHGGAVFGVLSAGDLLQFQAGGRDPISVSAWEVCTYKPLEVAPDTPLSEVARHMVGRHVHHVLVMKDREVVGVVSSLDFVRQFTV